MFPVREATEMGLQELEPGAIASCLSFIAGLVRFAEFLQNSILSSVVVYH
jgi:hypothetical protein